MKKLEDISKENIFQVPEGYFEKLPGAIQARVSKPEPSGWWLPALKVAMPLAMVIIASVIWLYPQGETVEEQLNEIQTEQLLAYLEETGWSNDLVPEEVSLNEDELNALESEVISDMTPIDFTLEEEEILTIDPDNF